MYGTLALCKKSETDERMLRSNPLLTGLYPLKYKTWLFRHPVYKVGT